jgi:hypothetical protein
MALSEGGTTISSGTYPSIPVGEEMVFFSVVDTDGSPSIEGWPGNGICSGGSGASGTVAKFCNKLSSGGQSVTLTLDLDGARVSAASGDCAPIAMCLPISSGTDIPIALLNGSEPVVLGTFPSIPSGASMLFAAEIDDLDNSPTITGSDFGGICGGSLGKVVGDESAKRFRATDRSYVDRSGAWRTLAGARTAELLETTFDLGAAPSGG